MIWTIILRFAIQDISVEEMTAKEGSCCGARGRLPHTRMSTSKTSISVGGTVLHSVLSSTDTDLSSWTTPNCLRTILSKILTWLSTLPKNTLTSPECWTLKTC